MRYLVYGSIENIKKFLIHIDVKCNSNLDTLVNEDNIESLIIKYLLDDKYYTFIFKINSHGASPYDIYIKLRDMFVTVSTYDHYYGSYSYANILKCPKLKIINNKHTKCEFTFEYDGVSINSNSKITEEQPDNEYKRLCNKFNDILVIECVSNRNTEYFKLLDFTNMDIFQKCVVDNKTAKILIEEHNADPFKSYLKMCIYEDNREMVNFIIDNVDKERLVDYLMNN